MNGYEYSKQWFNFSFENQEKITPAHTAVIMWQIELNNRMGWVEKFASPAAQTMAACGIKSYNTYKKVFDDLVQWGFINIITESKNQYTAAIIALSKFDKALDKALDKAITNHLTKQVESIEQSTCSIIKLQTTNRDDEGKEKEKKENFENSDFSEKPNLYVTHFLTQTIFNEAFRMKYKLTEEGFEKLLNGFVSERLQDPDTTWSSLNDAFKNFKYFTGYPNAVLAMIDRYVRPTIQHQSGHTYTHHSTQTIPKRIYANVKPN